MKDLTGTLMVCDGCERLSKEHSPGEKCGFCDGGKMTHPKWNNEKYQAQNRKDFEKLARPLIEFLNNRYHPHASITITTSTAEVSEGIQAFTTEDYILD